MASTYLTRTQGTPTNAKIWTISAWVKRAKTATATVMFNGRTSDDDQLVIGSADDKIRFYLNGTNTSDLRTNRVFRDTNAFYHIVVTVDTTQATSSDRTKLYINGIQETSFSTAIYPSQDYNTFLNTSGATLLIGGGNGGTSTWDGVMSHFHFIDGTAYDATAFGEYDANGVWKIKTDVSVTYGNNGFFILKDGNSVTDQSGNSNNFTVAGGTLTNTEDSPSNVFATGNPLDTKVGFAPAFSNGNNTISGGGSGTGDRSCRGTLGFASGKFYWEIKYTSNSTGNSAWTGILNPEKQLVDGNTQSSQTTNSVLFNLNGGELRKNGSLITTYSGAVNDIFGFAYDLDAGTLKIHKNGTYFNSGNASCNINISRYLLTLFCTELWFFLCNYESKLRQWLLRNNSSS